MGPAAVAEEEECPETPAGDSISSGSVTGYRRSGRGGQHAAALAARRKVVGLCTFSSTFLLAAKAACVLASSS